MNFDITFADAEMNFAPEFGKVIAVQTGENGATFIPAVSEDGIISWSNDAGLPNPEPVNIQGHTPVKGTDYWTEADKAEMVENVIAALPVYNGEVV